MKQDEQWEALTWHFIMEDDFPSKEALQRYQNDYPQYQQQLLDFTVEWVLDDLLNKDYEESYQFDEEYEIQSTTAREYFGLD